MVRANICVGVFVGFGLFFFDFFFFGFRFSFFGGGFIARARIYRETPAYTERRGQM